MRDSFTPGNSKLESDLNAGIESVEGLELPTNLEGKGDLNLGELQSAEGLEIPTSVPEIEFTKEELEK